MGNTYYTGIPLLQWTGEYPPCVPSVDITASSNPICSGDSVTFSAVLNCFDGDIHYKYGYLYNSFAVNDVRGLAATGWHVPTSDEWGTLCSYLGELNINVLGYRRYDGDFEAADYSQTYAIWSQDIVAGQNICREVYLGTCDSVALYPNNNGHIVRLVKDDDTLEDYVGNDGKVYTSIKCGSLVVITENLCETKYANGDDILNIIDGTTWAATSDGAYCAYDNIDSNAFYYINVGTYYWWLNNSLVVGENGLTYTTSTLNDGDVVYFSLEVDAIHIYDSNKIAIQYKDTGCPEIVEYGILYNWYAATDANNIAASDWHIPSLAEVNILITYLGGSTIAGQHIKEISAYWDNTTYNDNTSKFNMRGSGYRTSIGEYGAMKYHGLFWLSDSFAPNYANSVSVNSISSNIYTYNIPSGIANKKSGTALRLIKDSTTLTDGQTGTYTGNDGKIYRTICIGSQEWLADNLAETKYRDGSDIPEVTDNSAWAALTSGARCCYDNDCGTYK